MRVGIDVTCWCNQRGFGRFTRELVTALVNLSSGDEYVLFADQQTAEATDFPKSCHLAIANTSAAAAVAASADGRRSIRDVLAMRRMVQNEQLDLMFFPAVYSYFPINRGVPCIVTFHDIIAETLPKLVFRSWWSRLFWELKCRLAARRADLVVTVSLASKKGLIRHFGLSEDHVAVISEAPASGFTEAAGSKQADAEVLKRYGLEPGKRYILYVGGISPHKNIDTLIEAFAEVRKDTQMEDVHLVLVGDWAGDAFYTCYEELCKLVEHYGLGNAINFTGFVPDADLVHLYTACQAFVLPSYLEGFGLPAVEAMACGAAVVASNVGSLPEVLDGAGELFDPHDVSALAACLKRIIVDSAYQRQLQARSSRRALDFSWETSARQLIDIFNTMRF
ncbi:MAG: glycosyltransferase family 4 protein [Planctomycetes bacterium]|nr:glycosyltransferase family 4 protein [Planctomycetota bacterium]